VCCSVLQCVAVCGSVLQCVAVCCSVWQRVAACCSVLQCVAVKFKCCCSVLHCVEVRFNFCSLLQQLSRLAERERDRDLRRPNYSSAKFITTHQNTATHCNTQGFMKGSVAAVADDSIIQVQTSLHPIATP